LAEREHWEPLMDLGNVVYRSGEYVLAKAHVAETRVLEDRGN